MAQKLIIADLEFEQIKNNLKAFLQSQTTFLDYNFEGSSLAILINLLAFNTYYNSFYTNMIANELFIDSAQVRNSLLSHSKSLNYTPVSRRAPTAVLNITVTPPGGNTQSVLTMDRFQEFQSEAIDGVNYSFVTLGAQTVYKENGVFPFKLVEVLAGTPQVATFTYDALNNSSSRFELPSNDIDTNTILVTVQVSSGNLSSEVFNLSTDITESDSTTAAYYLSTSTNDKYQLTFGDGHVSKALSNGNIIIASYLSTTGGDANKANSFATGSIGGFSNVEINSVSSASGGAERETNDSIRVRAPLAYTSQGRAVSVRDYETLMKALYPAIQSIFVWGGEENVPPVYGKVFISIAPKDGVIINEGEKARIIQDILDPISITTVTPVLVDPDYVYLKFEVTVDVESKLTLLTAAQVATLVRDSIVNYTQETFNQFGAIFVISKFGRAVDDTLAAIRGSDTTVRLEKRFIPNLGISSTYNINFTTELRHAPIQNALRSSAFTVLDGTGVSRTAYIEEVFNSSTGIDSISITNPGYGYFEAPTVTITGDGSDAVAVATIVNGRVENITITKRGTSYNSALVTLIGGGGQAATASAVVESKFGTLRLFYFNSNSEKIDINPNIGTIDYLNGTVVISDLNVVEVLTDTADIRISVEPEESIIETQQNQLLRLDSTDVSAILTTIVMR